MLFAKQPRITLDQWRTLLAVVDAGGYAQAAEQLDKSQSTVTYAIKKLESVLQIEAFTVKGRRAVLTPTGELLYQRAQALLDNAARLEFSAQQVSAGWEPQIRISADVVFPVWLLLECFDEFGQQCSHTHIEFYESVMGGTLEDLHTGRADIALMTTIPQGFHGEPLLTLRFLPVASPEHALHQQALLKPEDLLQHRHLFVRETNVERSGRTTTQGEQRWTVSHMSTSIGAVCRGYGYAWFPEHKIVNELESGELKPLPLSVGRERFVTIYLVLAQSDAAGPGVKELCRIIKQRSASLRQ
ncbi:MAG: LysR family transcriptional regulator [Gammaproteobacteria bacterium]